MVKTWHLFTILLLNCLIITQGTFCIDNEIEKSSTTVICKKDEKDILLNFNNMELQKIVKSFIDSSQVTCINFEDNAIKIIEDGAFDKLPNLTYLNLAKNSIPIQNFTFFGGHEKLQTLILDGNQFHDVKKMFIKYCGPSQFIDRHSTIESNYVECNVRPEYSLPSFPIMYNGDSRLINRCDMIDFDDLDFNYYYSRNSFVNILQNIHSNYDYNDSDEDEPSYTILNNQLRINKTYIKYCGNDKKINYQDNILILDICNTDLFEQQYYETIRYRGTTKRLRQCDLIHINDLILPHNEQNFLKKKLNLHQDNNLYQYVPHNVIVQTYLFPELKYLYLRNMNFTKIFYKKEHFPKLSHLFLSENNLSDMSLAKQIQNSTITHLFIERNNITNLNTTFYNNIEVLSLDGNQIRKISNRDCYSTLCMQNFHALKILSISSNLLEYVHSGTFEKTKQLLALNLANNYISQIESETFNDLINLKYLNLSSNIFTDVPNFCPLMNLDTLVLNNNNFNVIPNNTFCSLQKLRKLHLNNNGIKSISPAVFNNINITHLDLSGNKLMNLLDWPTQSSLNVLYIINNSFQSLDNIFLMNAKNLELLDISRNYINSFQISKLKYLPENATIKFMPTF